MKSPLITLLTDFGLADHYVAAMKGVILSICPNARLVDISHDVTPYAIGEGAYTLAQAWHCFPRGTTHVAVVDPGVGSSRRAIAEEVDGHRFVAPDNGLLSLVARSAKVIKIREINAVRYFRQPVSDTFHGRDIFAPVAAHLANGLAFSNVGPRVADLIAGDFAQPISCGPGKWSGRVLKVDRFGNIITNLDWASFSSIAARPFRLRLGNRVVKHFYGTYAHAPAGQVFALKGSSGYIEVSLNQSDASALLNVGPGSVVEYYSPASTQ